jgi:5-methylcytosine-specific restriction enzyme A
MQFCHEPGCSVLVRSGRCTEHAARPANPAARVASDRVHGWYKTVAWRRLRGLVLRDNPFCRTCLERGRRVVAEEIDHIRRHNGDPVLFWDVSNLQGLCRSCHGRKTHRGE